MLLQCLGLSTSYNAACMVRLRGLGCNSASPPTAVQHIDGGGNTGTLLGQQYDMTRCPGRLDGTGQTLAYCMYSSAARVHIMYSGAARVHIPIIRVTFRLQRYPCAGVPTRRWRNFYGKSIVDESWNLDVSMAPYT